MDFGWMVPVGGVHLVVGRAGTSVEDSCIDFGWMVPAQVGGVQLVVGRSGTVSWVAGTYWLSLLELLGWSLLLSSLLELLSPPLGQLEQLLLSPLLGQSLLLSPQLGLVAQTF